MGAIWHLSLVPKLTQKSDEHRENKLKWLHIPDYTNCQWGNVNANLTKQSMVKEYKNEWNNEIIDQITVWLNEWPDRQSDNKTSTIMTQSTVLKQTNVPK